MDIIEHYAGRADKREESLNDIKRGMEEIIELIKAKVEECKRTRDMFSMPHVDKANITEKKFPTGGGMLYHIEYDVTLQNGETINIDYQSRDRCRVFQIRPDRSYIEVKCSDPQYNFTDSWDENN